MCPLTRPKAPPPTETSCRCSGAEIPIASEHPIQFAPCSPRSLEENRVLRESQPMPGRLRHPRSRPDELDLPEPHQGRRDVLALSHEIGRDCGSAAAIDAPGPARHCATASALIHVSTERIA